MNIYKINEERRRIAIPEHITHAFNYNFYKETILFKKHILYVDKYTHLPNL